MILTNTGMLEKRLSILGSPPDEIPSVVNTCSHGRDMKIMPRPRAFIDP